MTTVPLAGRRGPARTSLRAAGSDANPANRPFFFAKNFKKSLSETWRCVMVGLVGGRRKEMAGVHSRTETPATKRYGGRRYAAGLLLAAAIVFVAAGALAGEPGSPGHLFVSGYSSDNVVEFDENGEFVREVVADVTFGDDFGATGMAFGPNGNLFVCSFFGDNVVEYDGTTGELVGEVIAGTGDHATGWMIRPTGLWFAPDGRLLVCAHSNCAILAYDATTFEWLRSWAIGGLSPGGLNGPYGIALGPDGNVVVTGATMNQDEPTGHVVAYHLATGRLRRVVASGLDSSARGLQFDADGDLWLVTYWGDTETWSTGKLLQLDSATGSVITTADVEQPRGLVLAPNGNVLVAHANEVLEFDGTTGQLIGPFASSDLLVGAEHLVFKPAPPAPLPGPTLGGVSVVEHDACDPLTGITVSGANLDPAHTTIKLARAGDPWQYFGLVTADSGNGTALTVDFDLDGGIIDSGLWDVVVTNPDGQSYTLDAAIDIMGCSAAREGDLLATAYRHRAMPGSTLHGIIEYDGVTGDVTGWFAEDLTHDEGGVGELWLAPGLTFGPDGDVFVACGEAGGGAEDGADAVVRFDGITGRRIGVFVPAGSGGLLRPYGLTFGPNGNLFVVDRPYNGSGSAVFEYDGFSGAFVGVFVERGACGLTDGRELLFAEDGHLFATSEESGVIEFDADGGCIGPFGETGDPADDRSEAACFSPHNGALLVVKVDSDSIVEYDAETGAFIRTLVAPFAGGYHPSSEDGQFAFGPNGNLYVTTYSTLVEGVLVFDGVTGEFLGWFGGLDPAGSGLFGKNFDIAFYPLSGDGDGDWDVDADDFTAFAGCFTGDGVTVGNYNCLTFDFDGDTDVDCDDWEAFRSAWTSGEPIPPFDPCGGLLLGDLNCDGAVDFFDIDPFVLALTDPDSFDAAYPDCDIMAADCNGDGEVDFFDIDSFVTLLTGG